MNDLLLNFQVKGKTIAIDDCTYFYQDHGKGEVILLLHGFMGTSFIYHKIIDELQQNYRVIALDLPGFGFSSPPKVATSHRLLAKKIHDFLKALELEKVHFVVHDYSGPIVFLLLDENPDWIKSITVCNSFLNISKFKRYFPLNILRLPLFGFLFSYLLFPPVLSWIYKTFLMAYGKSLTEEESVALQYLLFSEHRRKSYLSAIRNIDKTVYAKRDMESGVRKMVGLRQILIGDGDRTLSPYHTEYMMEMTRISMAVRIPSGHFPMLENPKEFVAKVKTLVEASHGSSNKKKYFHFHKGANNTPNEKTSGEKNPSSNEKA